MSRPILRTVRRARSAVVVAILFGPASLVGARSAWAHGGQAAPPPPPPPTPDWMKPDPYTPLPPPSLPKGPLTPPTTTPSPLVPRPTTPPPFTPGGSAPPSGPPSIPPTPAPVPPTPAPTTPSTPPPAAGPVPEGGTGAAPGKPPLAGRRDRSLEGRRSATSTVDWTAWWDLNADRFRAAPGTRRGPTTGDDGDAERIRAHARAVEMVPFLRAVATGAHGDDSDLLASSFIALGKVTDEPADAERMIATLTDARAPTLAREGAAIGLGCLRRGAADARFDGRFLDGVRRALLDAFDDDRVPVRVRCFAAFSVGLLGDQPGTERDAFSRDLRGTTQAIWARLLEVRAGPEATVALLSALALQPEAGIPSGVREALRALAGTGRLAGRSRGDVAQAHAVVAYAKIAGPEATGFLLGLAKGSHHPADVRRSAILALGVLAPRLDPSARTTAVTELLAPARRGDPDTAGFALLSIGRLVGATLRASEMADLPRGAEVLVDATDHGSNATRPFAALALGLALRDGDAGPPCDVRGRFRARALAVCAEVLDKTTEDPACRAACALALGLAGDADAAARLGRLVADEHTDDDVRARAAGALGLLGQPAPETVAVLRAVLVRRSSDELRREAARALGALGDAGAVDALVHELRTAGLDHVRGRAAVALGAIGDVRAVRPLVALGTDRKTGDPVRAVAVAALGLLGDPERVPSLSRLSLDINYTARTDALNEVISLL